MIDLDTGKAFSTAKDGAATFVKLDVPIVDDKQSAHIKITGTFKDPATRRWATSWCSIARCTACATPIILPAGWEISALSQSGTIGTYEGRTFVALINLNGENNYRVTLRARKRSS